jgi:hypothetical protein
MPYCGRCLNVGRAGKREAPPEYGPVQPRQRCATSPGSTDSEHGQHAICGKPALIHEDLPVRALASSGRGDDDRLLRDDHFEQHRSTSASGPAQQSRTTTNP